MTTPQDDGAPTPPAPARSLNREILVLAVPALGALIAEPVFVLVDSAIVGHLGTAELAGLSLASTIVVTMVGLFVFLAYATTASVARAIGAGDRRGALAKGIDGMWLAIGLGIMVAVICWALAPVLIGFFPLDVEAVPHAVAYLRWSMPGLPGMLVVLASTGVLRGLQNTHTPLVVASIGAVVNAGLNAALVYGAGMGIAGSGLGTSLTQLGMATALTIVVVRGARAQSLTLRPHREGILRSARSGIPLFIRTLSLRVAILVTVAMATSFGVVALGAHQVINSIWGFTAFMLDALAIAAQALVGKALGGGDRDTVRFLVRRLTLWGVLVGAGAGAILAVFGHLAAPLFSSDPAVRSAIGSGLIVIGVLLPIAGYVFVLDGILIGAGDGRYLAWAGMVTLAAYLVCVAAVWWLAPGGVTGLLWLWGAFAGGFLGARAVMNGTRSRGTDWMVVGG